MDWIQYILYEQSPVQAVVVLSIIIAVGLGLGKIHVFGISLGVTWPRASAWCCLSTSWV